MTVGALTRMKPKQDRSIRAATRAEARACATIFNAWVDVSDWFPRIHRPEERDQYYVNQVYKSQKLWVVGMPVVGFLSLNQSSVVTALYTSKPGQGFGKRLLDYAKQQRDTLELWSFVANTEAQRFYQREGFVEMRRTKGDNEEGLPDILYRWSCADA
ncbi:MAG: GNAT family N-acetyltransferase [Pseudomonadota bacterium]